MKCQAYVVYRRLVGRTDKLQPIYWWYEDDPEGREAAIKSYRTHKSTLEILPVQKCDGEIIAHISAINEPYFGGTSAELSIEYKCSKCGCTNDWPVYSRLPLDENALSQFVTDAIRNMP